MRARGNVPLRIQFQIVASLLRDTPQTANVAWLVANGYLKRIR